MVTLAGIVRKVRIRRAVKRGEKDPSPAPGTGTRVLVPSGNGGAKVVTVSAPTSGPSPGPSFTPSGGGAGGISAQVSGPLPAGTTLEQAQAFRTTGVTQAKVEAPSARTIQAQLGTRDQKPFTFEKEPTHRPSFGVPFITKEEREMGAVGFVPQVKRPMELLDVPTPDIQTSPRTIVQTGFGRTKEDIIFTQRNILEAERQQREVSGILKEFRQDPSSFIGQPGVTQKGLEITLTSEFFQERLKPDKDFVVDAREFFKGLTKEKRRRAIVSSVGTGVAGFGVGLAEFGGTLALSLGQQTIDEDFKPFSFGKQFRFEGGLGKFRQQPGLPTTVTFKEAPFKFVGEKITSPKLISELGLGLGLLALGGGGALKNIKKLGVAEGTTQTLAMFSPIRPAPGIFTAKITPDTQIKVVSFKVKEGGVTKRIIVGKGTQDPLSLVSFQQTKGGTGFGETLIETPATIIKPSGRIIEGVVTSGSEAVFLSRPGQAGLKLKDIIVDLPKVKGGISESFTQQRFSQFEGDGSIIFDVSPPTTKFKISKGAGISKEFGEFTTRFGFGKREPIFKTKVFETQVDLGTGKVTPTTFIREPTGRFKFKPTITGREFDINKFFELATKGDGVIKTPGTIKKTPLSQTFQQQELTSQLGSIQKSLVEFKTPEISAKPPKLDLVIPSPTKESFLITPKTEAPQIKQLMEIKQKDRLPSFEVEAISQVPRGRAKEKEILRTKTVTKSLIREELRQPQVQKQFLQTKQVQEQILEQQIIQPFDSGKFDVGIGAFGGFGFGLGLPPLRVPRLGGFKERKRPKKRARAKGRIAPSFTGIVLEIEESPEISERFGVAPFQIRGLETGFKVPKKKKK